MVTKIGKGGWRPEDWNNPYDLVMAYRAKNSIPDESVIAVTNSQYAEIVKERQECFEAGADAMLEEIAIEILGDLGKWNPFRDNLGKLFTPVYPSAIEGLAKRFGISMDKVKKRTQEKIRQSIEDKVGKGHQDP